MSVDLPSFSISSASDAIEAYLRAGLRPILVHGIRKDGRCTCGLPHDKDANAIGKHPIARAWQKTQTDDELRNQLANLRFDPNVGIVLGEQPSGAYLIAIDVDDAERFAALEKELGALPPTPRCDSGRGYRLFFSIGDGIAIDTLRNVTGVGTQRGGEIKKGVDAKVRGGQVVVEPSMHKSGKCYAWTRVGEVADLPSAWALALVEAPVPQWARDYTPQRMRDDGRSRKRAEKYLERAVLADARLLSSIKEGNRNTTLHRSTVRLLSLCAGLQLGAQWAYVLTELEKAARASGLNERETKKTIASAESYVRQSGQVRIPVALQTPDRGPPAKAEIGITKEGTPFDAATGEVLEPPKKDFFEGFVEPPKEGGASVDALNPKGTAPAPSRSNVVNFVLDDPLERISLIEDKGAPAKTGGNVAKLISEHPTWKGGPMWDAYSQAEIWPYPLPKPIAGIHRVEREIVDSDFGAIQQWLMSMPMSHRVRVGIDSVGSGLRLATSKKKVDLLREWVTDEVPDWDRKKRIGTWTEVYLGVPASPVAHATGRAFLLAAIERALVPGTHMDVIPVLESLQGKGKNRAIETLFAGGPSWAPWVTIIAGHDLEKDETKRIACSRWIMHDDELRSRDPKRIDALKSWASKTRETYRLPYAREITVSLRRALLIGSTNQDIYLHDDTGNRRWWPWRCGTIRFDLLERDRMQLLAEAKDVVQKGGAWRDSITDAIYQNTLEEADERRVRDPLVEQIAALIAEKKGSLKPLTTRTIAQALGYGIDKIDRPLEMRVGAAMRELDYTTVRSIAADKVTRIREYVKRS